MRDLDVTAIQLGLRSEFWQTLKQEVEILQKRYMKQLLSKEPQDYAEYTHLVGMIQGISQVVDLPEKLLAEKKTP